MSDSEVFDPHKVKMRRDQHLLQEKFGHAAPPRQSRLPINPANNNAPVDPKRDTAAKPADPKVS